MSVSTSLRPECFVLVVGLAACQPADSGSDPQSATSADELAEGSGTGAESDRTEGPANDTPEFAIEEWGLMRIRDGSVELATANASPLAQEVPSIQLDAAVVGKPLIYVLPTDAWSPDDAFDVSIGLTYAENLRFEVWPNPSETNTDGLNWEVTVEGECDGSAVNQALDAHCAPFELPNMCEAAELERYITESRACLRVGEQETPALLYNGGAPEALSGPLSYTDARIVVGPDPIAHLWWYDGEAIRYLSGLAPGDEVEGGDVIASDAMASATAVSLHIRARLVDDLGLSTGGDFVEAWSPDVLADPMPWRAFGVIDEEALENAIPLRISPEPTRTTRMLAFTIEGGETPARAADRELAMNAGALAVLNTTGPSTIFGDGGDGYTDVMAFGDVVGPNTITASAGDSRSGPGPEQSAPSGAGVSFGLPGVRGQLDREIIQRVLRQHQREVEDCYTRLRASSDLPEGSMTLLFTIDSGGSVTNATSSDATISEELTTCVVGRAETWRFPEPRGGGVVNVTQELTFRSGD